MENTLLFIHEFPCKEYKPLINSKPFFSHIGITNLLTIEHNYLLQILSQISNIFDSKYYQTSIGLLPHICLNDYLKYLSNLSKMKFEFEARWSNMTLLEFSNMHVNIIKLVQFFYINENVSNFKYLVKKSLKILK